MRFPQRGAALALLVLLGGCGSGEDGGGSGDAVPKTVIAGIPCFADDGREVFTVRHEGDSAAGTEVSVREGTIDRFQRNLRKLGVAEATAKAQIIDPVIQIAGLYSRYSDRLPGLKQRAEAAKAALAGGTDFAAVAKESSDDPKTRQGGGELGELVRSGSQSVQDPGFYDAVWSAPVGELVGPFVTVGGLMLLEVTKEIPGANESQDRRAVRSLLFAWDSDAVKDGSFQNVVLRNLSTQIRVDVTDESYKKKLVPEHYWR